MAGFTHFLRKIFIPLLTAALLYLLLAHLVIPFIRRHRTRYSHYLPLTSDQSTSLSATTSNWRTKLSDAVYNLFIPTGWAARFRHTQRQTVDGSSGEHGGIGGEEDDIFDDEEGEGMVGFDPIDERRREALERRRSVNGGEEEVRRLGRDLEEGFRDDSEDEGEEGNGDERRRSLSRGR